jgi:hypothetical protein
VNPLAISRQNKRSTSRRSDGAPGDLIGDRPVKAFIHPAGLPISTSTTKVLRRPVESDASPTPVVPVHLRHTLSASIRRRRYQVSVPMAARQWPKSDSVVLPQCAQFEVMVVSWPSGES